MVAPQLYRFQSFGVKPASVLNAITELAEHIIRNIRRVLQKQQTPTPFERISLITCSNLIQQYLRSSLNSRCFVEENTVWLLQIARFRQLFIQLWNHPQRAGGVQFRHLIASRRGIIITPLPLASVRIVFDIQHQLTKEVCCALLFQRQQPALDGTNRCA